MNGEVKAYPIQFIGYHHQVQEIAWGKPDCIPIAPFAEPVVFET